MPAAYVGAAAAAGELGLNIANATSGGGGSPAGYQLGNPLITDYMYSQIAQSMYPYATSLPGQVIPGLNTAAGNIQSNPFAPAALSGATAAGAQGGNVAGMQLGGAGSLYGMGNAAVPYATQLLSTGFDPQNALYNRTQQQLTDQLNAVNAMNGVAGTPYGAGLMGQGLSNFNIDWQNAQLQRQAQAAQGYGNLVSGTGRAFAGASDLGTGGINTLASAGAIPYSTYLGQQSDYINALNALSSGYGNVFSAQGGALNPLAAYLKLGQSATALGQNAQATNFDQSMQTGAGLSSSLNQLLNNSAVQNGLSTLFAPSNPSPQFMGTVGGFDPTFGNTQIAGVPADVSSTFI